MIVRFDFHSAISFPVAEAGDEARQRKDRLISKAYGILTRNNQFRCTPCHPKRKAQFPNEVIPFGINVKILLWRNFAVKRVRFLLVAKIRVFDTPLGGWKERISETKCEIHPIGRYDNRNEQFLAE